MHEKRSPAVEETEADAAVLRVLLDEPGPWSEAEVQREVGNEIAATDALARLYGHGLVHRLDGFVFPTRAAAQFARVAS